MPIHQGRLGVEAEIGVVDADSRVLAVGAEDAVLLPAGQPVPLKEAWAAVSGSATGLNPPTGVWLQ